MTSLTTSGAANTTHIVYGTDRWTSNQNSWTDLPGAKITLNIGHNAPSYGAIFVATFSAEALASDPSNNGAIFATVFFGGQQAEPSSDNHRYTSANGGVEWSSHTFVRVIRFEADFAVKDVTAQVKIAATKDTRAGIQNWVLKVERFNL